MCDIWGGETALFSAVVNRHLEVVRFLLTVGADPDESNHLSVVPLLVASAQENTDIVHLLIEAGAKGNTCRADRYFFNALQYYAMRGDRGLETVEKLLSAGAKADDQYFSPQASALACAVESGSTAMVKRMLDAGAPIDRRLVNGMTALLEAAQRGHVEVVRLLLEAGAEICPPLLLKP